MITFTAATAEGQELIPEEHRFRVDPPSTNPFLSTGSIDFTQQDHGVEAERIETTQTGLGVPEASNIIHDMVARARLEVERFPESPRAMANYGFALLNAGTLAEAYEQFKAALAVDETNYLAKAGMARVAVLEGSLDEANKLYSELQQSHPLDPVPLMNLADVMARRKDFLGAAHLWKEAIRLAPLEALPRLQFGMVLLEMGRTREAIEHLREAARLDVRSPVVHHGLGVAHAVQKNFRQAAREFKAALSLAPALTASVQGLAQVLLQQGKYDDAVHLLVDHLAGNPEDDQGRELLAWAYLHKREYKEARSQLHLAIRGHVASGNSDLAARARLANNLGVCQVLLGQRGEAARLFGQAISILPDWSWQPYHNLASLGLKDGRPEQWKAAYDVIAECAVRFPDHQETQVLLAIVLGKGGRQDEAIDVLRQSVGSGHAPGDAYGLLGGILTDTKHDPQAALVVLREGHQKFPENLRIVNNLGYALLMLDEPDSAYEVLKQVVVDESTLSGVVLTATLGLFELKKGQIERAIERYRRAEQVARAQGQHEVARKVRQKMHLELARTFLRKGQDAAARNEVRKGLADGRSGRVDDYYEDLRELALQLQ